AMEWSKMSQFVAAQRNNQLRDEHLFKMRKFTADQVIFVDESGVDKWTGRRRTCWAPIRKASKIEHPLGRGQLASFSRHSWSGERSTVIYDGSTNVEGFAAWFIERLLPKCNPYPPSRSVLVMDN